VGCPQIAILLLSACSCNWLKVSFTGKKILLLMEANSSVLFFNVHAFGV
jgi:hypothetical protein